MKVIALISQKGGSGKTTLATSLATQGYIEGLKTLLIDLDPQGSSYKWGKRRTIPAPTVMTAQAVGLEQILEGAKEQGVDLVVIDTAPHSEKDARKACEVADLVLIPCRPSIHDLDAIEDTLNIAQLTKTLAFVVLNATLQNSLKMSKAPLKWPMSQLRFLPDFTYRTAVSLSIQPVRALLPTKPNQVERLPKKFKFYLKCLTVSSGYIRCQLIIK